VAEDLRETVQNMMMQKISRKQHKALVLKIWK